jgi:signal transduction histidine kinase
MRVRHKKTLSIRGPIILFSVILALILMLTVLWNVALVHDYQKFRELAQETASLHWTLIAVGSSLFLGIIVLSSILGAQLIARTRWSQRQSSFVASVTHELNSPLSAIKLFAQTLRGPDLDKADRTRFVVKILSEVERLNRMIGNILRAAEVDHRGERLPVAPTTVSLHAFIEEYLDEARTLRGDEIELSVSGEEDAQVEIDPPMFRQVLNNVVDNAVRHGQSRPARLEFTVASSDRQVELKARDNGVGIPPGELKSVFRPFSRVEADGARPASSGMGIGLFVVRSVVEAHDGQVGATSAGAGKGTTIWIRLPKAARPKTAA